MLEFSDILIILIAIITAVMFNFLGTEKLYRFYFGVIIGFLLFSVFNLQIKLFELSGGINGGWENFLVNNKDFVLGFFSLMIPVFGILFSTMHSDLKSNKVFSLLFGFFLPLFVIGIFAHILLNSAVSIDFLKNIFGFFKDSSIFNFLQDSPKIIFGLLLIVIFWKYIFIIIIVLLSYFAKLILSEIRDLNGENKNIKKEELKNK